jgi:low temperature requirement protein LtrA
MAFGSQQNLLRVRAAHAHSKVTFVELFFDLVFVFAITQLSHTLLEHFTAAGVAQITLLLLTVWWVWVFTSWFTNWIDPDITAVRLMLFALMLAGLVLSTSLPEAFGSRGLAFACAYVFMQVGRNLFMLWCLRHHNPGNFRNFQRITVWFVLSALFWLAGGFAEGNARFALWGLALAIEYAGPSQGFWVPGLGRSTTADWDIEGAHLAERCGLFIIIALGESILVTGATYAAHDWTPLITAAFLTAFIASVAMWWIYFNIGAEKASEMIAAADDPGRLGRVAYTYIPILLIAGIVVTAVGDELVLAHPAGHVDVKTAFSVITGPALFLFGNLLFKRVTLRRPALSHMVGLAMQVLLILAVPVASPLLLSAASTAVLIVVAGWDTISLRNFRTGSDLRGD